MNYEKFINKMFQRVDNVVWDMMSGGIGIQTPDGILSLSLDTDNAEESQVVLNMFDDFGMALPAFAQSTPIESVNVGDLIYSSASGKVLGWIVKKTEKSFRLLKPEGSVSQWNPPKVNMLGIDSGVLVLRSLMSMLPGGQNGLAGMQSMLMPMMMMGMGEGDLGDMMPMILMSQMGNAAGGDAGAGGMFGGGNMMQTMMFMKMMGKGGNMFGGGSDSDKPKVPRPAGPKKPTNFFD